MTATCCYWRTGSLETKYRLKQSTETIYRFVMTWSVVAVGTEACYPDHIPARRWHPSRPGARIRHGRSLSDIQSTTIYLPRTYTYVGVHVPVWTPGTTVFKLWICLTDDRSGRQVYIPRWPKPLINKGHVQEYLVFPAVPVNASLLLAISCDAKFSRLFLLLNALDVLF